MKNFKKDMNRIYDLLLGGQDVHNALNLSPEQINCIIENYKDPNYILGFHNTYNTNYKSFFKSGLYNQNSSFENTDDLANTVFWNEILLSSLLYPSGGVGNSNMCVILRMPINVFAEDEANRTGIYSLTDEGCYTIAPQYILAAFKDGKVIGNPNYNGDFESENAIPISNETISSYHLKKTDKNERLKNIDFFEKHYYRKNNIFEKMKNKIFSIFNTRKNKTMFILEAFNETNSHNEFVSSLHISENTQYSPENSSENLPENPVAKFPEGHTR